MIVRRIVRDVDGNIEATLILSPEQATFLINMGLAALTAAGAAKVQDMSEEEFNEEVAKTGELVKGVETPEPASDDQQKQFLAFVDKDTLHKA